MLKIITMLIPVASLALVTSPAAADDRLKFQAINDVTMAEDGRILVTMRKVYSIPPVGFLNTFGQTYYLQIAADQASGLAAGRDLEISGRGIKAYDFPLTNALLLGTYDIHLSPDAEILRLFAPGERTAVFFPSEEPQSQGFDEQLDLLLPNTYDPPTMMARRQIFDSGEQFYMVVFGGWFPGQGQPSDLMRPVLQVARWRGGSLDFNYGDGGVAKALLTHDDMKTTEFLPLPATDRRQPLAHFYDPSDGSLTVMICKDLNRRTGPRTMAAIGALVRIDREGKVTHQVIVDPRSLDVESFVFTGPTTGLTFARRVPTWRAQAGAPVIIDAYRTSFNLQSERIRFTRIKGLEFNLGPSPGHRQEAHVRAFQYGDTVTVFTWANAHGEEIKPLQLRVTKLDAPSFAVKTQATVQLPVQRVTCGAAFRASIKPALRRLRDRD